MRAIAFTLAFFAGIVLVHATESDIARAENDPSSVTTLILNGQSNEAARLLKIAPKLVNLTSVIIDGYTSEATASNAVASVAACNKVREISFRNCRLEKLPSDLRMLTQIRTFTSENSEVKDGEQFYNAIGDMPNVENVNVTGNDFRELPKSFSRMRVMKNISLVNQDLQLASGYELNTKSPAQLESRDSVQFGFGDDVLNLSYTCYNAEACKAHLQMFRDVLQGAYRPSNVFYTPLQSRVFHKQHPLVKPPVKGLDVFPDVYSYNAMTGTELRYGSGTKISIPENAFEDANGAPVTGNVDITYREFRDPVEIALSGIPMKYDSGGVVGDFESAGMFEINASQNGNEVFLQDGKKIGMNFAVVDTASTFNFYRLDEQKGWQYIENTGKTEQEVVPVTDSIVGKSPAVNYYLQNIWEAAAATLTEDTTSFDRRYADTSYLATRKYVGVKDEYYYKNRQKASSNLYLRKYGSGADYTLVRIAGVKYYNGNPEINAYNGYYWKIDGKQTGAQIRMEYGRNTGINDCRVINEAGQYFLELKYAWGFKRIKAEPVKMDGHHKAESISDKTSERLFSQYSKRLNQRRMKFMRDINRTVAVHLKYVKRAQQDSVKVYERTKPMMVDSEMEYEFNPWNSYVRAEQERTMTDQERAWRATGNVVQTLQLSGMGVFNCDQTRRLVKPVNAVTKVVKAAGVAVVPFIIYVIDKARNMVLTYSGNGGGVPITYGQNATNQLLMIDGAGNLFSTDNAQFNAGIQNGNGAEFEGQKVSGPMSTPQTVREAVFGTPQQ